MSSSISSSDRWGLPIHLVSMPDLLMSAGYCRKVPTEQARTSNGHAMTGSYKANLTLSTTQHIQEPFADFRERPEAAVRRSRREQSFDRAIELKSHAVWCGQQDW